VRTAVRRLAEKIKAALWKAIISDDVRSYVAMYYLPLLAWGIYGTFFAGPANYVQPVMGRVVYDVWVWLCMLATAVVMCGLRVEDKASGDRHRARAGVVLQTSGHLCMFWVLLSYEISAVAATHWGQGTFSIFAIAPYVVGCLRLGAQGAVKFWDGEW
jgi:hypothetical protein